MTSLGSWNFEDEELYLLLDSLKLELFEQKCLIIASTSQHIREIMVIGDKVCSALLVQTEVDQSISRRFCLDDDVVVGCHMEVHISSWIAIEAIPPPLDAF